MGYIGAEPATSFETVRKDRFTSQTGTTVTLSHTVSSVNDILVMVNSVKQDYTNYSVNGTTLTLGGSLVSADIVEVTYIGRTFQTVSPDTNTITNAMMSDDAIDSAEIVDGAVDSVHTNFVSTSSVAGLQIKGDGTTDGTLKLNCSQNTHGIKIKSPPHSANADYTLTMPNNDGSANEFLQSNGSGVLTWAVPTDTNTVYTHPNHSGEVTSTADGATVIADNIVDEANLKVSNTPTNGYVLSAQSGNTGGMTWAEAPSGNWVKLTEHTLSGYNYDTKDLDDSAMFTSTYDRYRIYIYDFQPQSDDVQLRVQFKLGGVLRTDGSYEHHMMMPSTGSANYVSDHTGGNNFISLLKGCGNASDERHTAIIEYSLPTTTGHWHDLMWTGLTMRPNNDVGIVNGVAYNRSSTGALTTLRFFTSSGNIENWHLVGYGLKS